MQLTKVFALAAALALFSGPIFSQATTQQPKAKADTESADTNKKTLSTRVVAYQIEAKLDPTKHTIA
ncbi:MAG: hypothetical protein WBQ07_06265, partial [Candidatus Acidiferrales bacterium]